MKIEKAIEILDNHQCDMPRNDVPDLIAAIKLGIEALINFNVMRELIAGPDHKLLPGETEE